MKYPEKFIYGSKEFQILLAELPVVLLMYNLDDLELLLQIGQEVIKHVYPSSNCKLLLVIAFFIKEGDTSGISS